MANHIRVHVRVYCSLLWILFSLIEAVIRRVIGLFGLFSPSVARIKLGGGVVGWVSSALIAFWPPDRKVLLSRKTATNASCASVDRLIGESG